MIRPVDGVICVSATDFKDCKEQPIFLFFIHFFDKTRKIFSAKLSDDDNLRVLKNPSNFFQKVTFKTIQKNKRIVDWF